MKLTSEQIKTFDEQGYLFFPNCFTEEEVALLRSEADNIFRTNRQEVWREKTGAPRTAFAAHTYNEAFRLLGAHPRLINSVEQIFARLYHQPEIQRHLLSRHTMNRQQADGLFHRYPAIFVSLNFETPRSGPLVNEYELLRMN